MKEPLIDRLRRWWKQMWCSHEYLNNAPCCIKCGHCR